ncbi:MULTISPECIES: ATP-binding protein [Emticicia]|uniref:tetratricopeptide repeat-containing sensor histidine kinase n=1 Tax=Emticicia TaxID=312278 RepID=UPI0007D8B960|nr:MULTISPECIES: ATP-binding protein [Emticicia]
MKKYICLFLFTFTANVLLAQSFNAVSIDSLKNELSKAKDDTIKVLILDKLTTLFASSNPTQALRYGREAWALASKIKYDKGKVLSALSSGQIMLNTSDYAEALNKLLEARYICEKGKMSKELGNINLKLALLYTNRKQFKSALEYLSKASRIKDSLQISDLEYSLNQTSGYVYKDMGKYQEALGFFKNAYQNLLKKKAAHQLSTTTYYIGTTFAALSQRDSALVYFRRSLSFQSKFHEGRVYYGLASIFKDSNKQDSAIFYAKKALTRSNENQFLPVTVLSAQLLSELYEKKNNLKEALYYNKIATAEKDSLFNQEQVRQIERLAYDAKERELMTQRRIEVHQADLEDKIKIYGLSTLLFVVLLVLFFLYRNNQIKHKANQILHNQKEEIDTQRAKAEKALQDLKATQAQLIQSEKLASLGELTAGIAHEIQNPLNFVNNFSELSIDLAQELKEEIEKVNIPEKDKEYIDEIIGDLTQNQQKINQHGKRASSIVKGMLQHSRTSSGEKELTDINALTDEYLRLSYHGLRAKDKNFNADFRTDFDKNLPKIAVISQEIGRVLLNLFNNAFYAVNQRNFNTVETLYATSRQGQYKPKVIVSTQKLDNFIEIRVIDNGTGMSEAIKAKIFQPFFTTKPTGEGTGLGLSLSYDIITKGHSGTLEVESTEGEGTEFIIKLPI